MSSSRELAVLAGATLWAAIAATACAGSAGPGGTGGNAIDAAASVLEHHAGSWRTGVYLDPTLTRAAAATFHRDTSFSATVSGHVYAQPLFVARGPGGQDAILVATEANQVYALSAASGSVLWQRALGAPVPRTQLPCGNIDPLGLTGTPVVDAGTRTVYLAAMTTPDGGATKRHRVFALSADDGSIRAGWPVDVEGVASGAIAFASAVQNQRGALAIAGGRLYVPYGGHFGDCGAYHGWLVGIATANPTDVRAWATPAQGGGAWAPSGAATDGLSVFLATGNTFGASGWQGGEAVLRFGAGPAFSGNAADWFAPTDWQALDAADLDIGGTGPVLVDLPGTPPRALTFALGKDGKLYVLDRTALGGVGGQLAALTVSTSAIIGAAAAWVASGNATLAFRASGVGCPVGQSGNLTAVRVGPAATPGATVLWCVNPGGLGSPMVTTTDGSSQSIVWTVGAEGDGRLRGYDGDTGAVVFGGGGAGDVMGPVRRYQTPILARGRIFVAGDGAVYAFTR